MSRQKGLDSDSPCHGLGGIVHGALQSFLSPSFTSPVISPSPSIFHTSPTLPGTVHLMCWRRDVCRRPLIQHPYGTIPYVLSLLGSSSIQPILVSVWKANVTSRHFLFREWEFCLEKNKCPSRPSIWLIPLFYLHSKHSLRNSHGLPETINKLTLLNPTVFDFH